MHYEYLVRAWTTHGTKRWDVVLLVLLVLLFLLIFVTVINIDVRSGNFLVSEGYDKSGALHLKDTVLEIKDYDEVDDIDTTLNKLSAHVTFRFMKGSKLSNDHHERWAKVIQDTRYLLSDWITSFLIVCLRLQ